LITATSEVPEPAAALLGALGCLLAFGTIRRIRSS